MNNPSIFKSFRHSHLRCIAMVTCFLLGSLRGFAGVFSYPSDTNSLRTGHQALPSFFEMNMGQWSGDIRFTSRSPGMNLLFFEQSVVYQLYTTDTTGAQQAAAPNSTHILNIGLHFRNPGSECSLRGSKPTGGYVNRLYGNDSSRWISNIPSYQEVQYSALYPGTYMLTITNTCGEVSDTIVFAPCPGCIADLPSAFSPNGDGVNDLFHILGEGISDVSFLIYDRHGQKVFETTHPDIGWDGTFKGVLQENEVYYYYLSVTCFTGETIVKKGDVTLIL